MNDSALFGELDENTRCMTIEQQIMYWNEQKRALENVEAQMEAGFELKVRDSPPTIVWLDLFLFRLARESFGI